MDTEKIKGFLQTYLDTILTPRYSKIRAERGFSPIEFNVLEIIEEDEWLPQIFHIYFTTKPIIQNGRLLKPHTSYMMNKVEKDIKDFLKMFSIDSPIRFHWNEGP